MDDFYHAQDEESYTLVSDNFVESLSDPSIYLKVSSVLFVRAGLFLSQVSSIPSSNIQTLIFQNIIDIAVNTVVYSLLGHVFAFGRDVGSFIGIDGFLGDASDKNEFAEGWLVIIAVSGLMVAAIGDRISFFSSLIINILISGFVFPVIVHWVASEFGWMKINTLARVRVSFKDYSYSCLIHMSGGYLAFLSLLILNKRLLRFKDMDASSIPDNGPSLTLFGNFFMIIGFLGIGIPTQRYFLNHLQYNFYGIILVNMLLSAFGSVTSALLLTFSCPCEPMHKWTSMRSIQAGISGIAVIAGGADVYYPLAALLIGICNGFLFFLVSFLVNMSQIEDYSNIIACHFVSGLIGSLLPPVFGVREGFDSSAFYSFMHFTWQFICDLAILTAITVVFLPVTFLLDYCSILRSWDEDINHRRAVFASKTQKTNQGVVDVPNWQEPQEVGYVETEFKPEDRFVSSQETVDVLFEKKQGVTEEENRFQMEEKMTYLMNTKPKAFFEVVDTDSTNTIKGCGDMKSTKLFDIQIVKGIRNISDSKLFQKFKETWTIPKKRTIWSQNRQPKFGSLSNIPTLGAVHSVETQV